MARTSTTSGAKATQKIGKKVSAVSMSVRWSGVLGLSSEFRNSVTLVTNDCGLAGWCNPGMLRACCDAKKEQTRGNVLSDLDNLLPVPI